jgi:TPR repeat protein
MGMKVIKQLVFIFSLLFPLLVSAGIPLQLSNVSAGLFRFQMSLAEKGNAEAQYKVGEMYELGKSVPKDIPNALIWYEKAADQGHTKAGYKILYLEIQANGLNDYSKTQLGVLRQEAAGGNPDAQYFLGRMYAAGVGVPKSLNNALTWLNKATFNGVAEAEHEAIAVEEELARIRAKEAQKRAVALEEAKQKKLEEERQKAEQAKAAEQKRQQEAQRKRQRELEQQRAAEERQRIEAQKQAQAEQARLAQQQKTKAEPEPSKSAEESSAASQETFVSDPCKGPQARFLSTCR